MRFRWLLLILLAPAAGMILPQIAAAQSPFWTQTSGPEGGLIPAMAVDSQQNVLAGTAAGGVFLSQNDGDSWFPINYNIGTAHIKFLQASGNGYDYAMTFTNGMYRYQVTDARYEWVHLDSLTDWSTSSAFVIDHKGGLYVAVPPRGITTSTNDGANWEPTAPELKDSTITTLAVDLSGAVLAITKAGYLFRSADQGVHWSKIALVPNGRTATSITVGLDGRIFVCDLYGSIYLSTDGGANWSMNFAEPEKGSWYSLVTNNTNGHLFVRNQTGYLFRSIDQGDHWDLVDTSIIDGSFFPMVAKHNNHLFLGTDLYGVFRSFDDGLTWDRDNFALQAFQIVGVASNTKGTIFGLTERLVFKTTDRGLHWLLLDADLGENYQDAPITIDSLDNVFIGTELGVLRSTDEGATWKYVDSVGTGNTTNLVSSIALTKNNVLFAATQYGLVKSVDHGTTWSPVGGEPGTDYMNAAVVGPNGEILATNITGALFRSADNGASWKQSGSATGLQAIDSSGVLYRISQDLFRSKDTGLSWEQLTPDPANPTTHLYNVIVSREGELLCGTDTGAFRSVDAGTTWIDVSAGLVQPTFSRILGVTTFTEDPTGTFYAASRGQGVFRSIRSLAVSPRQPVSAAELAIAGYPNPLMDSRARSMIQIDMGIASVVSVDLFDALGRKVSHVADGYFTKGTHPIGVTLPQLPAGAYYYRATAGGLSAGSRIIILR